MDLQPPETFSRSLLQNLPVTSTAPLRRPQPLPPPPPSPPIPRPVRDAKKPNAGKKEPVLFRVMKLMTE